MIDSPLLLADLKRELKALEADLRVRAEDVSHPWGKRLRDEYEAAERRERTGLAWIDWRDGEVSQAAVAWIIASVFIRFAEDNGLLVGAQRDARTVALPWIAAPGDGLERAVENEQAFYAASPATTSRDWLQDAFHTLADLRAGRPLVDPNHSAVWHAAISASASDSLLAFFRRTTPDGELMHDFSDPDLGTRFLGDLYQDLSDYAKKTYALLQTPTFVEQFILDQTLTPAIAEFGLTGLKLIDPACGSGHFLLGAFDRLSSAWAETAPGVEKGERVQRALDSIHGVDLNPFAIAIARFRLTVAAIKAAGILTLTAAPAFRYHLAIGDSLLGSVNQTITLDLGDGEYFEYDAEDLREYAGILREDQYHVVVANPPYIQPPDAKLRDQYRALYSTCHRKYALSVPFMELLFRLAKRPDGGGAGYVGQITSNSFMKREFGKKLIELFLSGRFTGTSPDYVDLSHIIDTSGAYIPGHGTPTVILIGHPRKPKIDTVRAVLGARGEPGQPLVPAEGIVWREIVDHLAEPGYDGPHVSVADIPRSTFEAFPWSLSGGGAADVMAQIRPVSRVTVGDVALRLGFFGIQGADDAFYESLDEAARRQEPHAVRTLVVGDIVRDWTIEGGGAAFFPYDVSHVLQSIETYPHHARVMWPLRTELGSRPTFSRGTYFSEGRAWYEWHQLPSDSNAHDWAITFASVTTHNHFTLVREKFAFKQSAPVIKLPRDATADDHYDLLGVLNSSVALFWLKQVSHDKGNGGYGGGIADQEWERFFDFTATKLAGYPLPSDRARELARSLDDVARSRAVWAPAAVLARGELAKLPVTEREWQRIGRQMVYLQEELDWRMYAAYGLASPDLVSRRDEVVPIEPSERAFEIKLARAVSTGEADTAWFERHRRAPQTDLPTRWPDWYRGLVERRLETVEGNPLLRLVEQPEYKRRWNGPSWDELLRTAVRDALLARLESPELWCDPTGRPLIRSTAQIADDLRRDERVRALLVIHTGSRDSDLVTELGRLLHAEAVPGLATLRYTPTGLEKYRARERTWELQRAEDLGEIVAVPVPPRFAKADYLKPAYWSLRLSLDVPKERFISFPGSKLGDDVTELYGWAGWDHGERGQATARLANDLSRAGAPEEQVIPLIGALIEIEPWLKQWHDELDARTGVSPAAAVAGVTTTLLGRLGLGRDAVAAWRPAAPARGRRSTS